ncbi:MAG: cobalamin B12-binding domain-containing protein [Woeseiaceae bacterium]|nr:cobalamin B12-binding domain-containing protein [Woeseiaceae bacterium]
MTRNGSSRPPERAQESFPGTQGQPEPSSAPVAQNVGEFGRNMLSVLSHTIEGDIIPRLMLALGSRTADDPTRATPSERLGESVDEFVHLLLNHDASVATNYVTTLRSDGIPLAALYLDLLAPAARRLGEMWEEDICSFTDVTIGVCRMHQVLLEFSRCFDAGMQSKDPGRNALILPVPQEQHTFGLFMVMEFMRKASWNCYSGQPSSKREFLKLAGAQDFDVIGLSVGNTSHLDLAAELVADVRASSRNRDAIILAGGKVFLDDPDAATRIGADAMAADGREAVEALASLSIHRPGTSQL